MAVNSAVVVHLLIADSTRLTDALMCFLCVAARECVHGDLLTPFPRVQRGALQTMLLLGNYRRYAHDHVDNVY
jgi:hypothetical protein